MRVKKINKMKKKLVVRRVSKLKSKIEYRFYYREAN